MSRHAFEYDGKRALIVGGASGIGAATAQLVSELGAQTVVMDYVDITFPALQKIVIDLRDRASIDAALAELEGPIHAVFSCAGVADGAQDLMLVNFIGQRYLIERLIELRYVEYGAAIGLVSSTAAVDWENHVDAVKELLDTDFQKGLSWVNKHAESANYVFSKRAVCAYVARQALPFLQKGIRINAVQPSPTDTPLARANPSWIASGREYRSISGIALATPLEQAYPLAFLCSEAASYVTGISLRVDAGRASTRMMHEVGWEATEVFR